MAPNDAGNSSRRDFAAIPNEIKALPRWVCWQQQGRNGKSTKVPIDAKTGRTASCSDATKWGTYDKALAFLKSGKASGIGFLLGQPYAGVDLDKCRNTATGVIEPWAQQIIERLSSYSEVSPSGTGVHIIVKGSLPKGRRRKGPVEMYDTGRFFTMTGSSVVGTSSNLEERQDELSILHAEIFGEKQPSKPSIAATPAPRSSRADLLADDDIIAAACRLPKFARLWNGDCTGYPSNSEADLALCGMLADWTGRDAERIDRLFRASKLFRNKWDERRGNLTYGELTIAEAVKQSVGGRPGISGDGFAIRNSDLGNAQRLVARHGENLRFNFEAKKFLIWNGSRWEPDVSGEVFRLAKNTIQSLYADATELADSERTELVKHALKSEAEPRIRAMVELAKTEPGLPVGAAQLDADPWLLNCSNGTLDLVTGRLLRFNSANLCTKQVPVAFDPDAECPTWLAFLNRVMAEDAVLITFLQRVIGYCLTGLTREQVLFLLYGVGANGKTTFIETIRSVLGDYAQQADFSSFLLKHNDSTRNDLARLPEARFVTAAEAGEGRKLDETVVKQATGGDKITARFLYHEFFEFTPQFKLFLVTNHKPRIIGTDEGIWRRIRLIPFTVTIPDKERDKQLREKLQNELPGILAWAVRGCSAWQRDGLGEPNQVLQATAEYRREMDPLADFLEDRCIIEKMANVTSDALYNCFKSWCDYNCQEPITQKALGTKLSERGFTSKKIRGIRSWVGLRLYRESDG